MGNTKSSEELLNILKSAQSFEQGRKELKEYQITESLSDALNALAKAKKAKLADVMVRSGLKKAYFYSLFSGSRNNPSRDVLIQLGFGFEMSLDEVQEFLKHRGAAQLYPRIPRDGVIIYCFQRKMSLMDCDELLMECGEPLLTKE